MQSKAQHSTPPPPEQQKQQQDHDHHHHQHHQSKAKWNTCNKTLLARENVSHCNADTFKVSFSWKREQTHYRKFHWKKNTVIYRTSQKKIQINYDWF